MPVPHYDGTSGYELHDISLFYDHLSRPIYIVDHNTVTAAEERHRLYDDQYNRLIDRLITKTGSTEEITEHYAHLDYGLVGVLRSVDTGTTTTDELFIDASDPTDLPLVRRAALRAADSALTGVGRRVKDAAIGLVSAILMCVEALGDGCTKIDHEFDSNEAGDGFDLRCTHECTVGNTTGVSAVQLICSGGCPNEVGFDDVVGFNDEGLAAHGCRRE